MALLERIGAQVEPDKTADGGFFVAPKDGDVSEEAPHTPSRPTEEEIRLAHEELTAIFGGENAQEADAQYRRGLHDVTHGRAASPDAVFYIHAEGLAGTANYAYDHPAQDPSGL